MNTAKNQVEDTSQQVNGCCVCKQAGAGALNHTCPCCFAQVCPSCAARRNLESCPRCGDVSSNIEGLQSISQAANLYAGAWAWLADARIVTDSLSKGALLGLGLGGPPAGPAAPAGGGGGRTLIQELGDLVWNEAGFWHRAAKDAKVTPSGVGLLASEIFKTAPADEGAVPFSRTPNLKESRYHGQYQCPDSDANYTPTPGPIPSPNHIFGPSMRPSNLPLVPEDDPPPPSSGRDQTPSARLEMARRSTVERQDNGMANAAADAASAVWGALESTIGRAGNCAVVEQSKKCCSRKLFDDDLVVSFINVDPDEEVPSYKLEAHHAKT